MLTRLLNNATQRPDPQQSLSDYEAMAKNYDRTISRITQIRHDAVNALDLKPGDRVLDVAFGTGDTLLLLAERVAPSGRVIGIEHSAAMADIARAKLNASPYADLVDIRVCAADAAPILDQFDAMLLSFCHDVLQHPAGLHNLMASAPPGVRLAVAGLRFLPWWWGWPVNAFNAIRARRYTTSFLGLRKPWKPLLTYAPNMTIEKSYLLCSCYLAVGHTIQSVPSNQIVESAQSSNGADN